MENKVRDSVIQASELAACFGVYGRFGNQQNAKMQLVSKYAARFF